MIERFVVAFQTDKTEHKVVCNVEEVEEVVEFHKKRGHVVCVTPAAIVGDPQFQ